MVVAVGDVVDTCLQGHDVSMHGDITWLSHTCSPIRTSFSFCASHASLLSCHRHASSKCPVGWCVDKNCEGEFNLVVCALSHDVSQARHSTGSSESVKRYGATARSGEGGMHAKTKERG